MARFFLGAQCIFHPNRTRFCVCVCLLVCPPEWRDSQAGTGRLHTRGGAFSHLRTWTDCSYMTRPGVQLRGSVRVKEATPAFSCKLCFPGLPGAKPGACCILQTATRALDAYLLLAVCLFLNYFFAFVLLFMQPI